MIRSPEGSEENMACPRGSRLTMDRVATACTCKARRPERQVRLNIMSAWCQVKPPEQDVRSGISVKHVGPGRSQPVPENRGGWSSHDMVPFHGVRTTVAWLRRHTPVMLRSAAPVQRSQRFDACDRGETPRPVPVQQGGQHHRRWRRTCYGGLAAAVVSV